MKVIISPDSFKGTMSSVDAATTIEMALKQLSKTIETVCLPVADGGEGTLDALVAATNGRFIETTVCNPIGREIQARYGVLGDGITCVIEMAQASGITLLSLEERNPLKATTFGTGQLIDHALRSGYRRFIIGIGGSATNDVGLGMLHALGVKFLDKALQPLPIQVNSLEKLHKIDTSEMNELIADSQFTIACDVDNPLVGERGATAIFGQQKGILPEQIKQFDEYLTCFADVVEKEIGIRLHDYPSAGAAGGIGGALKAFFPSTFKKGIDVVLEALQYEQHLQNAQLVITGEGKSDIQTLAGKAPMGIALKAKEFNVPTVLISGVIDPAATNGLQQLFTHVISVVGDDITPTESIGNPEKCLQKRVQKAFQTIL